MTSPVKIEELAQLSDYLMLSGYNERIDGRAVPSEDKTKGTINAATIQSDKYIVCKEQVGQSTQWIIVDLDEPRKPNRESINVDAIIVHPSKRIIACQNRSTLEIFDIEDEVKLKEHSLKSPVVYWKWIDDLTLDFVTKTDVYTWELSGSRAPKILFKKHDSMSASTIFDYFVDADRRWHVIVAGETPTHTSSSGIIQLFNKKTGATHLIDGYAACLCNYNFKSESGPTNYVICATKKLKTGKLRMKDLNSIESKGIKNLFQKSDESFPFEFALDYPIFVKATPNYGVIYLATKYGFIHIFDIESRLRLYSITVSQFSMISVVGNTRKGVVGINIKGQVISASLKEKAMLTHVGKTNPALATKLAKRWSRVSEENIPPEKIPKSPVSYPSSQPVVPSAPALPMDDNDRFPIHPAVSNLQMMPPSQVHLYAQPPPYSPPNPVERPVVQTDLEIRAQIAEMERDMLAARVAELELKYRTALTQKGQDERQGGNTNSHIIEEKQDMLRF